MTPAAIVCIAPVMRARPDGAALVRSALGHLSPGQRRLTLPLLLTTGFLPSSSALALPGSMVVGWLFPTWIAVAFLTGSVAFLKQLVAILSQFIKVLSPFPVSRALLTHRAYATLHCWVVL